MLKLDKSQPINTIAVHLNSPPENMDTMVFVYSQSYDLSNGTMEFYVDSQKGKYLIGGISGSQIPSPSGQYNIDIYSGSFQSATWSEVNEYWNNYNELWNEANYFIPAGDLLRTIRAWVSGSNDTPITMYQSPNELGTYTTYQG